MATREQIATWLARSLYKKTFAELTAPEIVQALQDAPPATRQGFLASVRQQDWTNAALAVRQAVELSVRTKARQGAESIIDATDKVHIDDLADVFQGDL